MCGLAGIALRRADPQTEAGVRAMIERVRYRGPDGQRTTTVSSGVLGHARLSIIDLDERSDQPFWSADKTLCVIFNGEIYNYLELRSELRTRGAIFHTESDTEVLLEAYRLWGDACWSRFNGMWAVALYNAQDETWTLCRDRYGVKPLYYSETVDGLIFGSELKQVILGLGHTPAANWKKVYAMFDRASMQTSETVFEGIMELPAGHLLQFNPNKETLNLTAWYDLKPCQDSTLYRDPITTFRALMTDAVRLRLRSDVPVGVCLSGGLDSSVITCLMAKTLGITPRVFSSLYDETAYSEERFVADVVAFTGAQAEHIQPQAENFLTVMQQIVSQHDEPIQMPGTYSQWHVMQLAHPSVRVVLDGQGGDEIVGGYYSFHSAYARTLLATLLRGRTASWNELCELLNGQKKIGSTRRWLLKQMLFGDSPASAVRWKNRVFQPNVARELAPQNKQPINLPPNLPDALARRMYCEFKDTNLPMLLKYEDRISMAFSIESRTPFLDYRLVEFCFGLPASWKMRGLTTKWILREAFRDILPRSVVTRTDKKGFPTPLALWMRGQLGRSMEQTVEETASSLPEFAQVFNLPAIRQLFGEHIRGFTSHERLLFRIYTTALWFRQWYGNRT